MNCIEKYKYNKYNILFAIINTIADAANNAHNLTEVNGQPVTLYAQWDANTYTVTFDPNGGTSTSSIPTTQTLTFDKDEALTKNTFTRKGYTFDGWNKVTSPSDPTTNISDGASAKHNLSTTKDGVTLYAQWEAIPYISSVDIPVSMANNNKEIVCTIKGHLLKGKGKQQGTAEPGAVTATLTDINPTTTFDVFDVDDSTLTFRIPSGLHSGKHPLDIKMGSQIVNAIVEVRDIGVGEIQNGDVLLDDGTYIPINKIKTIGQKKPIGVIYDRNSTTEYGIPYVIKINNESEGCAWTTTGTEAYTTVFKKEDFGSGIGDKALESLKANHPTITKEMMPALFLTNEREFLPCSFDVAQCIISNLAIVNSSLSQIPGATPLINPDTLSEEVWSYWCIGITNRGPGYAPCISATAKPLPTTTKTVAAETINKVRLLTW